MTAEGEREKLSARELSHVLYSAQARAWSAGAGPDSCRHIQLMSVAL
jgi:hypothetical protein